MHRPVAKSFADENCHHLFDPCSSPLVRFSGGCFRFIGTIHVPTGSPFSFRTILLIDHGMQVFLFGDYNKDLAGLSEQVCLRCRTSGKVEQDLYNGLHER